MVTITYCGSCKNVLKEKINGYIPTCKAYPEGIPSNMFKLDVRELKECNNGIKYEEKHPTS